MLRSDATVGRLARSRPVHLTLIVLVGAVLRFWGILHGLADGLIYHADAHLAVWSAWHLHLGGPLRGARFGAAHGVLSWLAVEATDLVGRVVGLPAGVDLRAVGSVLAFLTAVMGTLTIPAVYVLGAARLRPPGRAPGGVVPGGLAASQLPLPLPVPRRPHGAGPHAHAGGVREPGRAARRRSPTPAPPSGPASRSRSSRRVSWSSCRWPSRSLLAWRRRSVALGAARDARASCSLVLVGVSVFQTGHSLSPLAGARDRAAFAWGFITRQGPTVGTARRAPSRCSGAGSAGPSSSPSALGLGRGRLAAAPRGPGPGGVPRAGLPGGRRHSVDGRAVLRLPGARRRRSCSRARSRRRGGPTSAGRPSRAGRRPRG